MTWLNGTTSLEKDIELCAINEQALNQGSFSELASKVKHLSDESFDESATAFWVNGHEIDILKEKIEDKNFDINDVDVIYIYFDKFTDGRGFSLAYELRHDMNFNHEIWAIGDIIPDQYAHLLSCGFNGLKLPEKHANSKHWLDNLAEIKLAYQKAEQQDTPAISDRVSILKRRHSS